MATDAPTVMPTDPHILTLAQWFSPGYPIGSFSFSHGLEWAAHSGDIRTSGDLLRWLSTVLTDGSGYSDALFLAAAYRADPAEIVDIDLQSRAFAPSLERLQETTRQGAAFCKITQHIWGGDLPDLTYPVAVGYAAKRQGIALETTSIFYLHSMVANLVAAAQRVAPIGQSDAQTALKTLGATCLDTTQRTQDGDMSKLASSAFLTDIASMKHETQTHRIFQT